MTYTPTTRPRIHPTDLSFFSRSELTDTGDTKNIDHPRDVLGYDAMRERRNCLSLGKYKRDADGSLKSLRRAIRFVTVGIINESCEIFYFYFSR